MTTVAEPVTPETASTEQLIRRYHDTGDPAVAEAVMRRHKGLAVSRAARVRRPEVEMDDLIQVARMGMWKAVQRFRDDGGASFSTYATRTMDGELKRYYRDRVWAVRVPRGLKNLSLRVTRARRRFIAEHDHDPSVEELAAFTGLDAEKVRDGLRAANGYRSDSLDSPAPGSTRSTGDLLPAEPEAVDRERLLDVYAAAQDLPERQRRILTLRFFEDLTQREIAGRIGVSQMHVSRLLRRALSTLRAEVTTDAAAA